MIAWGAPPMLDEDIADVEEPSASASEQLAVSWTRA